MFASNRSRRCPSLWLALPVWTLLLSAISDATALAPPENKETPEMAEDKRELMERTAKLPADQRRMAVDALELFYRAHRYSQQTDYGRADPLYRQAAETFKKSVGENDFFYLRCLNNLGIVCQDTGDYPQAVRVFERLLEASKKQFGEEDAFYALVVHNLGDVYKDMGDLQKAEPLLLRSLELYRKTIGEKNGHYTQNLSNLARLYQDKGDYTRAEEYQRQDLDILKQAGPEAEEAYAVSLGNLALLYAEKGDFQRAEETLLRSQELKEKLGYQDWPEPGASVDNLGGLYYRKRDYAKAGKYMSESLRIIRRHFENTVIVQSERQQLNLARSLRGRLDRYLSLAVEAHLPPEQVYEQVLAFKGSVFAHQYWAHLARHRSDKDVETDRLYRQLQEAARELSAASMAPPDPQKARARQEKIQQLSEHQERLEAELSQRSATFANQQAVLRQTPERLSAALPSGAALIDFLEFHYTPPSARGDRSAKAEWRVLAVVARPDRPLVLRDLGSAQAIARACTNWRKELAAEEAAAPLDRAAAAELRRLVWQPLEPLLDGCRAVLLSPDSALASVPLGALPGSKPDSYLIEERAVAVLPVPQLAPQVLAKREAATPGEAASLLLLGDVDFDVQPAKGEQVAAAAPGLRAARGSHSLHFDRLAGTASEIESIRVSFTQAYPDGAVSEMRHADAAKPAFLRQVAGKRYLHLATHGFFAPPELQSGLSRPQLAEGAGRRLDGYHPGVLSGVALAGAGSRQALTGDSGDDGILTALEVAALDLSAAELVVLSACETGLGGVAGGEGLLGLQRAFQIAGARSVVASLWKVDDESTEQLMKRFYTNLWQKHLPLLEALRQAQLEMLRQAPNATQLRGPGQIKPVPKDAVRSRTHPRLWAAWILSGDPGDLSRLPAIEAPVRETVFDTASADPPVEPKTSMRPFVVGAGLLAVVLLVFVVLRLRQHSKPEA